MTWLYRKPFGHDHKTFFTEMYQVLNLVEAMAVPAGGCILEVGSGPGWVTEILMLLGYAVHAVEPSADMTRIAEGRVRRAAEHYQLDSPPSVTFHTLPLEEGVPLAAESADGVLFHAALHHIIDERLGLAECYRVLRKGGVLGVSEWAWHPGDRQLEGQLEAEMKAHGTLENPFSQEYLDYLLADLGFVEIQRFHAINGLIPAASGGSAVKALTPARAEVTNNLLARKPRGAPATCDSDVGRDTHGEITVENTTWSVDGRQVKLTVRLRNTGATTWVCQGRGAVRASLRAGVPGQADFREIARFTIPRELAPDDSLSMTLEYFLPEGRAGRTWELDLLAEDNFWFSIHGNACPVVG
jgi:SAM-dependent methyltransferase